MDAGKIGVCAALLVFLFLICLAFFRSILTLVFYPKHGAYLTVFLCFLFQLIVADMRKVLAKNPNIEQQKLHRRVFFEKIDPKNQALMVNPCSE
jgi:hypothetical protein